MSIELLGYSERGVINAICEDIHHSANPRQKLVEFLSWFTFSGDHQKLAVEDIKNATILVEQGFSDFGDLDLLALIECDSGRKHSFLIEAKVSNDTNSWLTVEDRWQEFKQQLAGAIGSTSNLFVQLHRKVRLVAKLREEGRFSTDCLIPRGSTGTNRVVNKACSKLKSYLSNDGNVWFGAVLPDEQPKLDSFAANSLRSTSVADALPTWCAQQWGFLSWHVVAKNVNQNEWPRTKATLDWNEGQIYREQSPIRYAIEKNALALLNSRPVFVVDCGSQNCQVIRLDEPDGGYFWKPTKVRAADLTPGDSRTPSGDLPHLPTSGATYVWDSRGEFPAFPSEGPPGGLPDGNSVVVVKRPSWVTTRVRLPENASDTFLVYTHQLRRG